eukprot:8961167-Alexandrium_andersonii.AAC.1
MEVSTVSAQDSRASRAARGCLRRAERGVTGIGEVLHRAHYGVEHCAWDLELAIADLGRRGPELREQSCERREVDGWLRRLGWL